MLAFRAAGHHLDARLPTADLNLAVGAIGIHDVHGSGVLAVHARTEGLTGTDLVAQLASGTIVEVISARGTDTLVPAREVAVFTIGTLPADEESLRARLKPFLPVLDRSGHTAIEALELAKAVAREALADGPLDIGGISGALTRALPELSPMCRGRCGVEHIEQGLFDLVGESGLWRQERMDGVRTYVAMEEPTDFEAARRELVRRYLRCYGPSTPAHFGEWCGISVSDAARSLALADSVEVASRRYLLAEDLERLVSPPAAKGVRVVPPRDPYLLDRDRATLISDPDVRRRIWRATPTDGVVLVDGVPTATWRPKKSGGHLTLNVEAFGTLRKAVVADLEREATAIATLRGCTTVEVAAG